LIDVPISSYIRRIETLAVERTVHARAHGQRGAAVRSKNSRSVQNLDLRRNAWTELDDYFQHQAGRDAKRRVATPFILVDTSGSILRYYTLSAYGIRLDALPSAIRKRLSHSPGQIGRQQCRPRQKAWETSLDGRTAPELAKHSGGCFSGASSRRALDDSRSFYLHHEFISLLDHPNRLFLAMATIEKAYLPK
jgi:hypothetical protein